MENSSFIETHVIELEFDRKLRASLKALEAAKELYGFGLHPDSQQVRLPSGC